MGNTKTHYGAKQQNERTRSSMRGLVSELYGIADAIAEQRYQRGFMQIVTLEDCIQYYNEETEKLRNVSVAGFILSVRENLDPRNENDNYVVVQGLIDAQNKPVAVNGESASRIMHTRTIDDALIKALNGEESVIVKV